MPDYTQSDPYGTAGSDAATYTISDVSVGEVITKTKFNDIHDLVQNELTRREHTSTNSYNPGTLVKAVDLNVIIADLDDAGYTAGIAGVTTGNSITASHINETIDKLQSAGAECLCNCNYCTCNCNYCTCNCNYSCTCNCNYSDMRLKKEIEFIEERNGLNIYTFKYLWDDVKRTGVMAQEILKTKWKDAVHQDKNGYYMVDYGMLPYERS